MDRKEIESVEREEVTTEDMECSPSTLKPLLMPEPLSQIEANRVSFGRSQGFPLRIGWLPKIANSIKEEGAKEKEASSTGDNPLNTRIARFGVGKNMVESMQYWANVATVTEGGKGSGGLTELGRHLFGEKGADPYIEDESTLWLLHWHLVSRPAQFTANYWLFNHCFYPSFTAEQAVGKLESYLADLGAKTTAKMMKKDLDVALRMYASRRKIASMDDLDTPFLSLELFSHDDILGEYCSEFGRRETLPPAVLGYAATQLMQANKLRVLPVRGALSPPGYATLEYSFRIMEESLLEKLAQFSALMPQLQLRESAGTWQLHLEGSRPSEQDFLAAIYG